MEVLVGTPAVRNMIRKENPSVKFHDSSRWQYGMQTMESSFKKLIQAGIVSPQEAINYGVNINDFNDNNSAKFEKEFLYS